MKTLVAQQQINEMRDLGRSMPDKGFFEVDMVSTHTTWMNECALSRLGLRLDQTQAMKMYDLFPEEFHDQLASNISSQVNGEHFRFSIWPLKTADGKVTWWYVVRLKAAHPYYWYKGEFLNSTGRNGPEYSSMVAAMATTNSYNELFNHVVDLRASLSEDHKWAEQQVQRLDENDKRIDAALSDLGEQLRGAVVAAKEAAGTATDVKAAFTSFQREISDRLAETTKEIVQLVTADTLHDKRVAAIEEHLKKTADAACNAIVKKADEQGNKLARRVVIPTGVIYLVAEFARWLWENWPHK